MVVFYPLLCYTMKRCKRSYSASSKINTVCSRPSTRKKNTKGVTVMRDKKVVFITQAAMIAAIYVVVTVVFSAFSFGEVQVRISEALTVLPMFTPAAIPGLFIGCILGNTLGGAIVVDVVFGSLATLIGAVGSYLLRKHKFLVPLPPIVMNVLIVPFVLKYGYGVPLPIPFMMGTVGIGEVISCGILGYALIFALEKVKYVIFRETSVS